MLRYVREGNSNKPWHWHENCPNYPKKRPYVLVYHDPSKGHYPMCPICRAMDEEKRKKILTLDNEAMIKIDR